MKALLITDMECGSDFVYTSAQVEALGGFANVTGLEDNGGNPDGDMWLVVSKHDADDIATAVAQGAQLVRVYEAEYDSRGWLECADQFSTGENWSGIGSMGKAWFIDFGDAKLCQRTAELMREDDDLDTLAYRLNCVEPEGVW